MTAPTRVLVLGGTGMLGHTLFEHLDGRDEFAVHATVRDPGPLEERIPPRERARIHPGVDASRFETVARVVDDVRPHVVVNAIGIVRQLPASTDPIATLQVNALLPHRLARLCAVIGTRLIQVSTDCVFSGATGNYVEDDAPDPDDLYGRSKLIGEPREDSLVLRTSMIGHELRSCHGLLEWLLAQSGAITGYRRAIFSGLPTVELARVIADIVLNHPDLAGVYHVSSAPISKHDLLGLIARRYDKRVEIVPSDAPAIDRSLDSTRFRVATGYRPPSWPQLVESMHVDATARYGSRLSAAAR